MFLAAATMRAWSEFIRAVHSICFDRLTGQLGRVKPRNLMHTKAYYTCSHIGIGTRSMSLGASTATINSFIQFASTSFSIIPFKRWRTAQLQKGTLSKDPSARAALHCTSHHITHRQCMCVSQPAAQTRPRREPRSNPVALKGTDSCTSSCSTGRLSTVAPPLLPHDASSVVYVHGAPSLQGTQPTSHLLPSPPRAVANSRSSYGLPTSAKRVPAVAIAFIARDSRCSCSSPLKPCCSRRNFQ